MLRQQAAQLREKIIGLKAQVDGLDRQRALLEEELVGARELLEKGFTPKTRVLALDRTMAQLEADRGSKLAEIASSAQAIGEAELNLAKAERSRITEITDSLRAAQSKLAELRPKIEAAQDVLDRTRVNAPMSGAVVSLTVFTEGGVIQPGARLLDVIPADDPLIVDARLQLSDINQITPGQSADIRRTGVPRNERPRIRGEVMTVSADRITDERSGRGYYVVRVRPDAADVAASRITLQSGMPAEVVVTTRPRTLVDYLFSPLLDEMHGAFRER
jgi:membrane fusion protein, epimerase transport system